MSKLAQLRERRNAKAQEAQALHAKYTADQRMPKEDAEDMFKRFDTNQDGRIEFPDFVKMVVPHEYDIAEDEVLAVMKLLPIELADV